MIIQKTDIIDLIWSSSISIRITPNNGCIRLNELHAGGMVVASRGHRVTFLKGSEEPEWGKPKQWQKRGDLP